MTKHMLIIKDARGEIVAAQVEDSADGEVAPYITPAQAEHTLYRVSNVPAEIQDLRHPDEFYKAITEHAKSRNAKIALTNADELHAAFASRLKT
jgi:hypothetical protein